MNIDYFKKEIIPNLPGYNFQYSSFKKGDFGDLERVEFEGYNKIGTIDLWSHGWVGIDIYDCNLDEQIINVLLEPDEIGKKVNIMKILKEILNDE